MLRGLFCCNCYFGFNISHGIFSDVSLFESKLIINGNYYINIIIKIIYVFSVGQYKIFYRICIRDVYLFKFETVLSLY